MRAVSIHASAVIDAGAEIDSGAEIGAFCTIGSGVRLGAVKLASHVVIDGCTTIGDGCHIRSFACIGGTPQISNFDESQSGSIEIGVNCQIREYVTVNSGSPEGSGKTIIGSECLLMIGCHVAHDCHLGDRVILINHVDLAGHVEVGESAVIGGLSGVRPWVRIGHHAMVGFMSGVESDVIPYGVVKGERAHLQHLNWPRMRGFDKGGMRERQAFFKELFLGGEPSLQVTAHNLLEKYRGDIFAEDILHFILQGSNRTISTPKHDKD